MPNWTAVGQIGQTVRSYARRTAEKIGPIASRLSRSLNVIESDSDRSVIFLLKSTHVARELLV